MNLQLATIPKFTVRANSGESGPKLKNAFIQNSYKTYGLRVMVVARDQANDSLLISQSAVLRTYSMTLPSTKAFSDVLPLATRGGLHPMYNLHSRATRIALDGWSTYLKFLNA